MAHRNEMEVMAAVAHGMSATLNVLGVAFNLWRARRVDADVILHGLSLVYHVAAVRKHARRV